MKSIATNLKKYLYFCIQNCVRKIGTNCRNPVRKNIIAVVSEEHIETEDDLTLIYYSLHQCLSMLQKVFFQKSLKSMNLKPSRFEECFRKKY